MLIFSILAISAEFLLSRSQQRELCKTKLYESWRRRNVRVSLKGDHRVISVCALSETLQGSPVLAQGTGRVKAKPPQR